tara:strand:- start:999 stop:1190 length:192 start_codon:yes stop_codon:yes gene_type:complete
MITVIALQRNDDGTSSVTVVGRAESASNIIAYIDIKHGATMLKFVVKTALIGLPLFLHMIVEM